MHIVHPKDRRIIPFDTYNLFYRDELERAILEPLRAHPQAPGLRPQGPGLGQARGLSPSNGTSPEA